MALTLSGKTKLIFSKIKGRNDGFQLPLDASHTDHHPGIFDGDGSFGKHWQCCQEYDAYSVGCHQCEEIRHHPKNYQEARANCTLCCNSFWAYVGCTIACFPCCFIFGISVCVQYASNPQFREDINIDPDRVLLCCEGVPISAKWLCCGNKDRSANGCRSGPHPEHISFFENFLPAGLLNRDQGSLSCSVDLTGNSVLCDKREFAWIGNGEYVGWLQTPPLIANCKAITIKLISQSSCPHFAGKLSILLVKNGMIVASEEVTLVNSTNVSVYMINHKSLLSMSEAGDVIEVHRYSGHSPRYQLQVKGVELMLEGDTIPLLQQPQYFSIIAKQDAELGDILTAVSPLDQLIQFTVPKGLSIGDSVTLQTPSGPSLLVTDTWELSLPIASDADSYVNWLDGDNNTLFYLNLRPRQRCFVMNAHFGFWGTEERSVTDIRGLPESEEQFPRMSGGADNLVVTVKVNDVSFEVWVAGTLVTTFTHRAPWDTFTSVTVGPGCSTTRLTVDLLQLKDDPARPTLHTRVMADTEWYKDARGKLLEAVPCRDPEASAGSLISGSWVGTFVVPQHPHPLPIGAIIVEDGYDKSRCHTYPSEEVEIKVGSIVIYRHGSYEDFEWKVGGRYYCRVTGVNPDGTCDLSVGRPVPERVGGSVRNGSMRFRADISSKTAPSAATVFGEDCLQLAVPRSRLFNVAGVLLVPGDSHDVAARFAAEEAENAQKLREKKEREERERKAEEARKAEAARVAAAAAARQASASNTHAHHGGGGGGGGGCGGGGCGGGGG